MAFIIVLSLVSCRAINIHEEYGYNIYNDKEKVEHCSEICIIRIDSKIDNNTYKITLIDRMKKNCEEYENYNKITLKINLFYVDISLYYLLFYYNQYNISEKFIYGKNLSISDSKFIIELKGYDESLKYYEQTGECKSVIDYYINLINDK